MSFSWFNILAFSQFFLSGVFLFTSKINSVEEIILGSVTLWGMAVVLLSFKSAWDKFGVLAENLKKIPQSESYRTSLASGLTSFVLSIVVLGSTVGKFGYDTVIWFVILFVSSTQLVKIFSRAIFQIKAARRFDRRRKYLRLKNA